MRKSQGVFASLLGRFNSLDELTRRRIVIFSSISAFVISGVLFYQKLLTLLVLLAFAAAVQYITLAHEVKFNMGHVFFISIILARVEGAMLGLVLLLVAGLVPQLFVDFDESIITTYPIQIAVLFLSVYLKGFDVIVVGIILALLSYAMIWFLAAHTEMPWPEQLTEVIFPMIMNILYFVTCSTVLEYLLAIGFKT